MTYLLCLDIAFGVLALIGLVAAWHSRRKAIHRIAPEFIDVATGEYLDNIAKSIGLRRFVEPDDDLRERIVVELRGPSYREAHYESAAKLVRATRVGGTR